MHVTMSRGMSIFLGDGLIHIDMHQNVQHAPFGACQCVLIDSLTLRACFWARRSRHKQARRPFSLQRTHLHEGHRNLTCIRILVFQSFLWKR